MAEEAQRGVPVFSEETTLHGFRRVADSSTSKARRIIWLLLLTGMSVGCIIGITSQLSRYWSYPIASKETTDIQSPMPFPAVTLCSSNKVRLSYVNKSPYVKQALQHAIRLDEYLQRPSTFQLTGQVRDELSQVQTEDMYLEGGFSVNDVFPNCTWAGSRTKCSDILTDIVTTSGRCYTFNAASFVKEHGRQNSTRLGSKYGLRMSFVLFQFDFSITDENFAAGAKILLHEPDVEPNMERFGFLAAPGFRTQIAVEALKTIRLPAPYEGSTCLDTGSPHFTSPLAYHPVYSQSACQLECERNYTVDQCQCLAPGYKGQDVRPCNMLEYVDCIIPKLEEYDSDAAAETRCGCRKPCTEVSYIQKLSMAKSPSSSLSAEAYNKRSNLTPEFFAANVLDLVVYFEELQYRVIEQIPAYPFSSWFADLGGQMGVCVGASIITILELAEFGLLAALVRLKRFWSPNQVQNIRQAWHTGVKPISGSARQ